MTTENKARSPDSRFWKDLSERMTLWSTYLDHNCIQMHQCIVGQRTIFMGENATDTPQNNFFALCKGTKQDSMTHKFTTDRAYAGLRQAWISHGKKSSTGERNSNDDNSCSSALKKSIHAQKTTTLRNGRARIYRPRQRWRPNEVRETVQTAQYNNNHDWHTSMSFGFPIDNNIRRHA